MSLSHSIRPILTTLLLASLTGGISASSAAAAATSPPNTPSGPSSASPNPLHTHDTNLILNGDFEHISIGPGCWYNQTNSEVDSELADITAFGSAQEIDVMSNGTGCFGDPPQSGAVKLAIHRQEGGPVDAFSFTLSTPLVVGNVYMLTFYAEANTTFDPNIVPVLVGVSSVPTDFGMFVYSGLPSTQGWTALGTSFHAPINASYLTVMVDNVPRGWDHIDNFWLVAGGGTPTLQRSWGALKSIYR